MNSNKFVAKLLGAMFLIVIVFGVVSGEMLGSTGWAITGQLENISETMINFSDSSTIVQLSIIGFLFEALAIVLLAVLLFETLKKQNKIIARWAFGLWIIEAVFIAVKQISSLALLFISQEYVKAGTPDSSYFQTLGSLFNELMQFGYDVQMIFYCTGGILFYYLFFKSKYVPRALSLFGIIAASLGFIGELFALLGYNVLLYVFVPIFPFELGIGIWLLVKGFNSSTKDSLSTKDSSN